jgi:hypothetical protein
MYSLDKTERYALAMFDAVPSMRVFICSVKARATFGGAGRRNKIQAKHGRSNACSY